MMAVGGVLISREAFEYLKIQRGDLFNLILDPLEWAEQYRTYVARTVEEVLSFASRKTTTIMDIGSGLGVVDVILHRLLKAHVTLLDGEDTPARVIRQDRPYMDRSVLDRFMADNNVVDYEYMSPQKMAPKPMDLILSFQSWGFHYPISWYLPHVLACCKPTTRVIVDIRLERPAWCHGMSEHFRLLGSVAGTAKWQRTVWELR